MFACPCRGTRKSCGMPSLTDWCSCSPSLAQGTWCTRRGLMITGLRVASQHSALPTSGAGLGESGAPHLGHGHLLLWPHLLLWASWNDGYVGLVADGFRCHTSRRKKNIYIIHIHTYILYIYVYMLISTICLFLFIFIYHLCSFTGVLHASFYRSVVSTGHTTLASHEVFNPLPLLVPLSHDRASATSSGSFGHLSPHCWDLHSPSCSFTQMLGRKFGWHRACAEFSLAAFPLHHDRGIYIGNVQSLGTEIQHSCWLRAKEHVLFEAYPCMWISMKIPLPGNINHVKVWSVSHRQISGYSIAIQIAMGPWMVNGQRRSNSPAGSNKNLSYPSIHQRALVFNGMKGQKCKKKHRKEP